MLDEPDRVACLGRTLLELHSDVDTQVGVEYAAGRHAAARHLKSSVALNGSEHLVMSRRHAVYAARIIAAWTDRYLRSGDQ